MRLKIWEDIASNDCGVLIRAFKDEATGSGTGVLWSSLEDELDEACKARIVADFGVSSPRIAFKGGRDEGRRADASFPISLGIGVGVPDLVGLSSGVRVLSGDRSWDREFSK